MSVPGALIMSLKGEKEWEAVRVAQTSMETLVAGATERENSARGGEWCMVNGESRLVKRYAKRAADEPLMSRLMAPTTASNTGTSV